MAQNEVSPTWSAVIRFLSITLGLIGLCSCATNPPATADLAATELPAEARMNKFSRFAPELSITLRLQNGPEFVCYLDTGSPGIVLPKSVEHQMGKRIGKLRIETMDGSVNKARIYAAPKIYLGETPLVTGEKVGVWDLPEGIIGMDCLRHYCIQLDFQTGKVRFLKPGNTNSAELGKAFPLTSIDYAHVRGKEFFALEDSSILIDTGFQLDGTMRSSSLKHAVQEHGGKPVPMFGRDKGRLPEIVSFPSCTWAGETYTNVIIQAGPPKIIGLRFLARHLVTFDFPNKIMYLKYPGRGRVSSKGLLNFKALAAASPPAQKSTRDCFYQRRFLRVFVATPCQNAVTCLP
jgi:predicted aspartyl protease